MPIKTIAVIAGLEGESERAVRQAINDLIAEVNVLSKQQRLTTLQTSSYNAREGEVVRINAGLTLNLPRARIENQNAEIGAIIETDGTLTVTSTQGLVDGVGSIEVTRQGLTFFRSNGSTGWFSTGRGASVTGADIVESDFDWESTLDRGATSGANDPIVEAGRFMQFGLVGPTSLNAQIRSGDAAFRIHGGAQVSVVANTNLILGANGGVLQATSTSTMSFVSGTGSAFSATTGNMTYTAVAGDLILAASDQIKFNTNGIERFVIEPNGAWDLAGDEGALGEVLTSQGAGTPPVWAAGGGGGGVTAAQIRRMLTFRAGP